MAKSSDLQKFLATYEADISRPQFESTLFTFLASLTPYADFIMEHDRRDFHLGLEDEDAIFIEAILNNYHFLSGYLKIDNPFQPSIH